VLAHDDLGEFGNALVGGRIACDLEFALDRLANGRLADGRLRERSGLDQSEYNSSVAPGRSCMNLGVATSASVAP